MTATVPLEELVSAVEVAKIAMVQKSCVSKWVARHPDFPPALHTPGLPERLTVFDAREIRDWLRRTGRMPK